MEIIPSCSQCPICLEQIAEPKTIEICSHKICKSCFNHYLKTLLNIGKRNLSDFKCPIENCTSIISQQQLYRALDFQLFQKIHNRQIYKYHVLCPNCNTKAEFMSIESNWNCQFCLEQICMYCKSRAHEGNCQQQTAYFNEVRGALFQEQEVGYCPACQNPFLKDQRCDHVKCQNDDCNFQFCFACYAPYSPIVYHGKRFHRTDCRNYEEQEYKKPSYNNSCLECRKNHKKNTPCKPPKIQSEYFLMKLIHKKRGEEIEDENQDKEQDQTEKE